MATNFPASLDTLTNPTSSDSLSSPSHSAQHANVNDAVEALQAKVGVDSSAVTSSLDYKVAQLETSGASVSFTPSWNNLTPGDGSESAFYTQTHDLVVVHVLLDFGSTTSVTGQVSIDHPVGSARIGQSIPTGVVNYVDDDGNNTEGVIYLGVNSALLRNYSVSGSQIVAGATNPTNPHTWAANDRIRLSWVYQIA
jgi:hypothetical protein